MLKLNLRSMLSTSSTRKVLRSRWPFHDLGVTNLSHSIWSIAHFLASEEDEEALEYLLRAIAEYFLSLSGENPDTKRAICDNSCAIFNTIENVFPLATGLSSCAHFAGKNLRNWGAHLIEYVSIKDAEDGARSLQSITSEDHLLVACGKLIEKC